MIHSNCVYDESQDASLESVISDLYLLIDWLNDRIEKLERNVKDD